MNDVLVNRSNKAAYRIIDREAMVVAPGSDILYVLNRVGSRIWEMADGETRTSRIARALCEEFDVAYDRAYKDTLVFVSELSSKGLLELQP